MPTTSANIQVTHAPLRVTEGFAGQPSRLAASRILSETAHDLRSPLTSVRETIRLVASGDLGSVNDCQQQCLVDAVEVCDSMERLVSDMLQLERMQSGRTRAVRQWFDIEPVCYGVSASLHSVLRQRSISVVWDGIEATTPRVFGDADKVSRILCNLISNAARETAEHQHVLVRARRVNDGQTLKICVIDSGRGMNLDAWSRTSQRGVSERGSEGLGLSICRQLASAHYSPLTLLSRLGRGTEISFELPIGGPTSVAAQWVQWRGQQPEKTVPRRRDADEHPTTIGPDDPRIFTLPDSQLLLLHHDGPPPQHRSFATVVTVSAGATVSSAAAEMFDQRLQRDQRAFDLVYRVSDRRWVVVWDANQLETQERIASLEISPPGSDEGELRLTWSPPRVLNLSNSHAAVWLADILTRESLHEREPVGMLDDDMLQDGGTRFSPSPIPVERLRAELAHLASRLNRQSKLMYRQAKATAVSQTGVD
ncbi:MAG: sensor histidine kinase [Planctomycetaceae bacterium]